MKPNSPSSRASRPSSWFVFTTLGLLGLLTVAVTTSYLILLRQSGQLRVGVLTGSSMEPTLRGPRVELRCGSCTSLNSWTNDAWTPGREVRCQFCNEFIDTSDPIFKDGESVVYVPTILKKTPIRRWDLVVIDSQEDEQKEPGQVKRVVGLPRESVSIRNGRLWIDGVETVPSPEEFMHQAILVSSWSKDRGKLNLSEFISLMRFPIDNQLAINAHDSHQLVPVQDIGIAFRMAKSTPSWNIHASLLHGKNSLPIEISCYENDAQFLVGPSEGKSPETRWIRDWKPVWVNVIVLGNELILLDEKKVRATIKLGQLDEGLGWGDLSLTELDGLVDQCLVYRGLHLRGVRDTPEQEFAPAEGWIVLGDNVSISEDSRFWAPPRVPNAKIRGLLKQRPTLMEGLMKQP
ncbi:MAG: S26 family signal peptidase [Pirellula sp.]